MQSHTHTRTHTHIHTQTEEELQRQLALLEQANSDLLAKLTSAQQEGEPAGGDGAAVAALQEQVRVGVGFSMINLKTCRFLPCKKHE